MRSFRDSSNVEWTVFEVRRQVSPADESSVPALQASGWLCFESDTSKRRLLKYPERWRDFGEPELTRLLQAATPAPRTSPSLSDGVEGGSPAASGI
jgi:hypothetical protein